MNIEEKECERLARRDSYDADALSMVKELRTAGFDVENVGDLYRKKLNYQHALPILAKWLPLISNKNVKEDIVRALSVKWAKKTAIPSLLLTEFKQVEDPTGLGLRWAIGNALEVLASDEIADKMINIAEDSRYGRAREMIVLGLGKLKKAHITNLLINLLSDEDVVGHAVIALGEHKAKESRPYIEALLNHPKAWVRNEARKALKKIDKAEIQG